MVARAALVELAGEIQDLPAADTLGTTLQDAHDDSAAPPTVIMAAANPVTWVEPTTTTAGSVTAQVLARSGGNLAVGDGVAQDLALNSDAGVRRTAFRVVAEWSDPTDGSEDSEIVFMNRIAGILLEGLRFRAVGVDTQITTPFAFIISPNAQTVDGLQITVAGGDTFVIPQTVANAFNLGNTVADPSVNLNRGNARAFDIIPLGTTITVGAPGDWITLASTVTLDVSAASFGGFVSVSGTIQFRQAGNSFGAGNLFKISGTFKNESGFLVSIGSQYTFVHIGTYQADGVFAQSNFFHRICLFQPTWSAINGATMTVTTTNVGGLLNPTIGAGVTLTNMRDWEWSSTAQSGTIVDRAALYMTDIAGGTSSTALLRSFMLAGATRRMINHTGTAQSDFGGPIGLGAGATVDITLERLAAGIMTLGTGQSMRVPNVLFMGASGSINLREGATDRLDLGSGDSFRIINGAFEHLAGTIGFHGATPQSQDTGWLISNVSTLRAYDANTATLVQIADTLGTLIETVLKPRGDIAA